MIDVFVSRPSWVGADCRSGLEGFLRVLGTLELRPRTVGATDYPTDAPLDEVIRIMSECSGALILGYPQVSITSGTVKGDPIDGELHLSTEWNHIEAGLAYARGLPLLVIHHLGVARGVFDRGAIRSFIYQVDFTDPSWSLREEIQGALATWKANILRPRREATVGGTAPPVRPVVSDEQIRVLRFLAESGDRLPPDRIAAELGLNLQRTRLHLDQLKEAQLVGRAQFTDGRSLYTLAAGGRVLLAERGLI